MIKKLLFAALINLIFTGCYFIDPINTPPGSSFSYEGLFYVGEEIRLAYNGEEEVENLQFEWKMKPPGGSSLGENSFIQHQNNNVVINQFIPDVPGHYIITLIVTDEYGARDDQSQKITIQNRTPYAILNYTTSTPYPVVGGRVILDGRSSYDRDNNIKHYRWVLNKRPASSRISSETIEQNKESDALSYFIPDYPGEYEIGLKVFDVDSVAQGVVKVYVQKNQPPEIIKTTPDHRLPLIALPVGGVEEILAEFFDDGDRSNLLIYRWRVKLNGVIRENITLEQNQTGRFILQGGDFSPGDLINLELIAGDLFNHQTEVVWNFVIIP